MAYTDDKTNINNQVSEDIIASDSKKEPAAQLTDAPDIKPVKFLAITTSETPDIAQSAFNRNRDRRIEGAYYRRLVHFPPDPVEDARKRSAKLINSYVWVQDLPHNTTAKDIRSWFSKYGTITRIHQRLPSRSKAGIVFETLQMAQSLMEQEGKLRINGKLIRLYLVPEWEYYEDHDDFVEFTTQSKTIAEVHDDRNPSDFADEMRDTLRLIQGLEPARGYVTSMVSLYLNNRDSSMDGASVDQLIDKLEQEYKCKSSFEFPWRQEYHEGRVLLQMGRRYGPSSKNIAATQESIKTIKKCLQLNSTISGRGRVIFCGTVFTDNGVMKQVLVEFEPYTLVSDKSYCYFDNKFHLGPLAFKLIYNQRGDGLRASDFKKVSEAFGDEQENNLASFTIEDSSNYEHSDPIFLGDVDLSLFGRRNCYSDIPREVRVAELTRILRLIESLRVSSDDNTKKIILIVEPNKANHVMTFLNSSPDIEEARNASNGSMAAFGDAPGWRKDAEQLPKVGRFPVDLSAKRCFEFAEERLNLYSQENDSSSGLIVYCDLGMASNGREMKFSIEIDPYRPVRKNRVIYIPSGHHDLKPLEELVFLDDDLVPFALDPKNAPPGVMSHEKRNLLIGSVEELARKPTT